jgi:GNAT superfamily N-acetyltransferase
VSEVILRRALPADAAAATALARAAKAHWGYPAEWLEAWREELSYEGDYFRAAPGLVRGAERGAGGGVRAGGGGRALGVAGLWVDPLRHGVGIGRALAEAARAAARGLRPGWPVRIPADPQAVGFYERLAARRDGALPAPMPGAPGRVLPLLWWDGPDVTR